MTFLYSVIKSREETCVGCSAIFRTTRLNQTRCTPDCGRNTNAARTRQRAEYIPEFIGVDGEGVTLPDGSHRYVLLSVGERSYHREGEHLRFPEIADFLLDCFAENDAAVYCGYYLGYDFAQWLRTLPAERVAMLLSAERRARTKSGGNTTPFPVEFDGWEFDALGMKRFKIRRAGAKKWMHICDVGPFYQQPFATAILGWQDKSGAPIEIATPEEMAIIEEGKAKRATAKFDKAMIEYNVTENRVLSRMMKILAEGFKEGMGVQLLRDQWYGPGQIAQKWMDENCHGHTAKALQEKAQREPIFAQAMDAARKAYYGGWFEACAHGHVKGSSWEYDIVSAYPKIQSELPCLLHGQWTHAKGKKIAPSKWQLVRASVEGSNPYLGAMLHRDKHGKINRPDYTSGWFWRHELEAAQRAGLIDKIVCAEAITYEPCKCLPPFRGMRASFEARKAVGKKTPVGIGYKLKNNSCYGKKAQSIGLPKHADPIYASLITAGTRTMILDAIATHPRGAAAVLKIATDGIYFDQRHPTLNIAPDELGAWEETEKRNLSIFLPGIYWDDKAREGRKKQVVKLKSRGVNGADLIARLDALDAQFDRMLSEPPEWSIIEGIPANEKWWAELSLPIRFQMVTPRQALARGKWELAGTVTQDSERTLFAHPRHKRSLVEMPSPAKPYIHTLRPRNLDRVESTPYNKSFGLELAERMAGDFVTTPEGDAISEAYIIMKGG